MPPGFASCCCVSSSCPLHPIKASRVALLYMSKKPRDPYNLIGFCDSKKFSSGVSKWNPQKYSNKRIIKKPVLKTSMSTQSSLTFLWVRALENILKSRSSLVSAVMRCYLGWLTRLQRTELLLQLTPPVKCANQQHGPTWVACRPHCRYHQSA